MWNTGCRSIVSHLPFDTTVRDEEDNHWWHYIPPNATVDFNGIIFPWCSNTSEVRTKAFAFYSGTPQELRQPPLFYTFQNYYDNRIYWVEASSHNLWADKKFGGAPPSSYADIEFWEQQPQSTPPVPPGLFSVTVRPHH